MKIKLIGLIIIVLTFCMLTSCEKDLMPTKPIANFDFNPAEKIRISDTLLFLNKSINSDIFYWDFGDENYSREREPKHIFKNKNAYNVKLYAYRSTVTNEIVTLETDSMCKIVDVCIEAPKALFIYNRTSVFTVSFTNTSLPMSNCMWDFGDGITSTEKDPTHSYKAYGTYKVKLIAMNDGVVDSISKPIDVLDIVSLNSKFITDGYFEKTVVDVDLDGIADFRFLKSSYMSNSYSSRFATIETLTNFEIYTDTTSSTEIKIAGRIREIYTKVRIIPKIFVFGNQIQNSLMTTNGFITLFEIYSHHGNDGESTYNEAWNKDEIRYICFRKVEGDKTKIGWIKLNLYQGRLFSFKIPIETESLLIDN